MSPAAVQVTAVSYSRISQHAWCPATLRFSLSGLKEPESPQMRRGNEVHKMLERYLLAPGKAPPKLPVEFAHLKDWLAPVRKLSPVCEAQFAYTAKWEPTEYFAKDVRWRMKVDVRYAVPGMVTLLDYKTGKIKPEDHGEQLELYTLVELLQRKAAGAPVDMEPIQTAVFYVDHEDEPRVLSSYANPNAKLLAQLKKKWQAKGEVVIRDREMKATPREFKCSRCFYSGKRGGPCKAAVA